LNQRKPDEIAASMLLRRATPLVLAMLALACEPSVPFDPSNNRGRRPRRVRPDREPAVAAAAQRYALNVVWTLGGEQR
jgi:hypothetical protein